MKVWGKILGGVFGFMLGGPIGALIGVAIGHAFDRGLHRVAGAIPRARAQGAFFTAVFSVLGHLSKADGRVNENEIRMAEAVMDHMGLPAPLREHAKALFRRGKEPGFSLDAALADFARESRHSRELTRIFLEILLQSAYADGDMHAAEARVLERVRERLSFPRDEFARLDAMMRAAAGGASGRAQSGARDMDLARAYQILGCNPDASDAEIKKQYRLLLSQHHPDKLVAKGLPEEMMKLAAERTVEIRQAYERLRAARGF